jgi:hypothetical protein
VSEADRNQIILTPAQTPPVVAIGDKVVFSFDFYDLDLFNDTDGLDSPYRQNVSLQYRNPTTGNFDLGAAQLIGLGMNNNQGGAISGGQFYMGRVLGFNPDTTVPADNIAEPDPDGGPTEGVAGAGIYFKLNDFSTGVGTGPGSRPTDTHGWHNLKVEISTDDGATQDYAFYVDNQLAEIVSNSGPLRQYNVIRVGSGLSSPTDAYYDNFKLEYIDGVAPPTNDSDFNEDGVIDTADYTAWRKFNPLATGATEATGDADGDGDNDDLDYAEWVENYGGSSPTGGSGAVPEPAGVVMLLVGLAALAIRRRG